jgi:ribonuclease VapC
MFVDASALVGILNNEPEAPALLKAIEAQATRYTSPVAIFEATAAIMRERRANATEAGAIIKELLTILAIKVMHITESIGFDATLAFERYGKGRHPAALNMGDCFSYACAKAYRVPLLYKGNDFSQTDLA